MEPERSHISRSEPQPRKELRALAQLRDRVEAAARELERLRAENAALEARVAELQAGGDGAPSGATLPGGEHAEKLKAQIQGFIDTIDQVLNAPEAVASARAQDA